ncbi:MAG: U32 family peptidase [SAR324 cluster bacterium]|jgi:putative protease|nr:U32 family peptidase [SAR324 cluster bacterium]MDP6521287.1 U32 family peptidase [SAR324 cluster bacterium]|tara:strand:- start:4004 stop:5161 length:1158 start_codon:yes stop_codon:yes gene_type:complete
MKFNTYLDNKKTLKLIQNTSISEVILEHKTLSRMGRLDTDSLLSLTDAALESGLSPVLQWDTLCTESNFENCIKLLDDLPLSKFAAIRVQDIGAAEWVRHELPEIPLHFIAETGNHNLTGLLRWHEYFGQQLQRFALSSELPISTLNYYCRSLTVPCEILAAGRILLFYTPRKLLGNDESSKNSFDFKEKILVPSDQPQRQIPTLENQHGTFMYHHKDLFLLDFIPELQNINLKVLRLDFRHMEIKSDWIKKIDGLLGSFDKQNVRSLKSKWPSKITRGFFRANRTDLAIDRIKNPHRKDHGEALVGCVVEAVKEQHLIMLTRKSFQSGKSLLGITPEGRECIISTESIHTTDGKPVSEIESGNLYQVPHVKYVTAETLVYSRPE